MTTELATTPSVGAMLQNALAGIQSAQITPQHVDVLKGMMDLYERDQKRQAERDFVADFVALKQALPPICAIKVVLNKDGTVRYKFAPLEEIDRVLRPIAHAHGFTYSFTEEECARSGSITKVCIVQHRGGHSARHPYSVRIGGGPPGSTESQSDGSAHSYAKRGALCDAFGIVVEHDSNGDDARGEGKTITAQQAAELKRRVKDSGADEAKFLGFAGAATFESITEDRLSALDAVLRKREARPKEERNPDGTFKF